MKFVGVDGCRAGWFATWRCDECYGHGLYRDLASLWNEHSNAQRILVDIPIGLTNDIPRRVEPVMRSLLGRKSSSVFPVPCKAAVYAEDYVQACEENLAHYGKKISRQAWNICRKIMEMDRFLKAFPHAVSIVGESHPELTFSMFAGTVLNTSKKKPAGIRQRLETLSRYRPQTRLEYRHALDAYPRKEVARDDIVDAMILRLAAEDVRSLNTAIEEHQTGDGDIPIRIHVPTPASLLSSPDFI
ncbi:MAG: DUF429 domain-containing protein [bacterium]